MPNTEEKTIIENKSQIIINDEAKALTFHLQKNARLVWFDIILDNQQAQSSLEVILEGEGASVEIIGLFFGTGSQNFDISHVVRHKASHTTSKLTVKGALDGEAKATYRGLIEIAKGSVGCSGEQSEHTLLLSDKAHIEAVPTLEIGNNEVKATHSVSTTYIDDLKKFYLESRGMEESEAIQAIVQGHFARIIDRIENTELKTQIEKKIALKIKHG